MWGAIAAITALAIGVLCSLGNGEYLEPRCGLTANTIAFKIIGGRDAIINSNPWMAYIHSSVKLICGGTLITQRKYVRVVEYWNDDHRFLQQGLS